MWQTIKKHAVEALLTAVIGLITYIGKEEVDRNHQELQKIRTEMAEVRCTVALTTVESLSESIDDQFFTTATDDLSANSPPFRELQTLKARFGKHLNLCDEGRAKLKEIDSTLTGLSFYIDKSFPQAAQAFAKLNQDKSVVRRWRGAALIRAAESLPNGKEADQFREQGVAQFAQMVEIAERERGTHLKEVFVAHQRCYPWAVERTAEGNREAVKCYLDNVNSGKASYLTYYNLAALYSRMGEFDRAIANFGVYLKEGGLKYDKRSQVESDKDFKEYLLNGASDKQKTQFRILLEKMRA